METVSGCELALEPIAVEPIGLELDLTRRFCFGLEIAIDHLLSTSIFLLLRRLSSIVETFEQYRGLHRLSVLPARPPPRNPVLVVRGRRMTMN